MRIIGLHGRKRVGKDTVADILCQHLNYRKLAFADPIYEMLHVLQIPAEYREEKLKVIPWLGKSYTELLQTLGTEWGRGTVREDLWIRILNQKVIMLEAAHCPGVVISDVRYDDEASYVTRVLGGAIWEVVGSRGVIYNEHSSERRIGRLFIDRTIDNSHGLIELEAKVLMEAAR